jgi:hypothetical protein
MVSGAMGRPLLPVLALLLAAPAITPAAEGDWGAAHIFYVKKALAGNWSAITGAQLTWRDDMSDFYFIYADAGLAYKFHPNWIVEAVYRQGWWEISDQWEVENRPLFNLKWIDTFDGIRIENQARLELRFYDWDKDDDLRFRNRTRMEFPWEVIPVGIKPYLEEELFIGKNSGELEMNWLMAGLYYKPTKQLKLKAGYRWIAIRAGNQWENRNQLVTGLALIF